jgi:hypothetical protein
MELPDDVLTIIRDYSRPLKRREISEYWHNTGIFTIDEMILVICKELEEQEIEEHELDAYHIWIWNGQEFDDETNFYGLMPDYRRRIQYLNDNGVVHTSDVFVVEDIYDYTP